MANKRPSLTDQMRAVQGDRPTVRVISDAEQQPTPAKEPSKGGVFREGKKRAVAALSLEDHRRLKRLSADTGDSIEKLMLEAVTDLLAKHGV